MLTYLVLIFFTALAATIKFSKPLRYFFFFIPTILIIGFRYEVGFDWHLYKFQFNQFSDISITDFFSQFPVHMATYSHEPFFLITSYLFSQILPEYEYMQIAVYLLFMYSTYKLGKVLRVSNIIASFIPIHFFLLFTLEFSAIRQIIAISFFNIGLAFFLQRKQRKMLGFYIIATLNQFSSLFYIIAQNLATSNSKRKHIFLILSIFVVAFLTLGGLNSLLTLLLPDFIGSKLNFYLFEREYKPSLVIQIAFLTVWLVTIFVLLKARKKMKKKVLLVTHIILLLCFLAIATLWLAVVHNRLMYELIILISLLVYGPEFSHQKVLRYFILLAGLLFFTFSMKATTSFVFIPYQNYIWFQLNGYESNGYQRYDEYLQLIRESRK
jgi:hypothetical protein